jgi:hypothetical protein
LYETTAGRRWSCESCRTLHDASCGGSRVRRGLRFGDYRCLREHLRNRAAGYQKTAKRYDNKKSKRAVHGIWFLSRTVTSILGLKLYVAQAFTPGITSTISFCRGFSPLRGR